MSEAFEVEDYYEQTAFCLHSKYLR